METSQSPRLNPWFSMWTQPRHTMRQILDSDPSRFVLVLAAIAGISRALDRAGLKSLGDQHSLTVILAAAIVGGALSGILLFYLFSFALRWTGRWFAGRGSLVELRAAIAWPHVITAWALVLWVPQLLLAGEEIFTSETPRIDTSLPIMFALLGLAVIEIAAMIWSFVVLAKCVGEAQGFSSWKALGNVLVAVLLLVVPLAGLAILLVVVRP